MEVKVLNLYNNDALPDKGLQGSHGESFLITVGDINVLLDTGMKGDVLLGNMARLEISPDDIGKLVISHGHIDHTGGLSSFLEARKSPDPIPLIAHPEVREPKALKAGASFAPIGFPELGPPLLEKVRFELSADKVEIAPGLYSIGEVPLDERKEKPGAEPAACHQVGGEWEWDPVVDDLSLALRSDHGLVIVTGCCHAGLLNTCARAVRIFGGMIHAVIGGTHMMRYTEEEVEHVGDVLEKDYGLPRIYLNHCTGRKAILQLRERFGPEKVHDCLVGTELVFNS